MNSCFSKESTGAIERDGEGISPEPFVEVERRGDNEFSLVLLELMEKGVGGSWDIS